jgi:hypothetical protein
VSRAVTAAPLPLLMQKQPERAGTVGRRSEGALSHEFREQCHCGCVKVVRRGIRRVSRVRTQVQYFERR